MEKAKVPEVEQPEKKGVLAWLEKQGGKKPAWSEEDERMWSQVINEIEAIKSNSSTVFEKNIAQDKIDWLKSLKDRVQPKIEWSREDRAMLDCVTTILCEDGKYEENERQIEWLKKIKNKAFPELKNSWGQEDEEHIHSIISTIECCKKEYKHATAVVGQYNSDLDWLKSLRIQSQWKPSVEQIEALDFAVDCIVWEEFCVKRKVLKELLEQLKKL